MSLAFGIKSPRDMLSKAERDLKRLETAHADQDERATSDALFDFAVSITSLKDWLKEHPSKTFSASDVEAFVAASIALSSFRDIANGGKHRVIRKYQPETIDTASSATSQVSVALLFDTPAKPAPGAIRYLKIIRADGSRHRALNSLPTRRPDDLISRSRCDFQAE